MSHVYQPVMLISLLENGGKLSTRDIAKSILGHDQSQIEYYEKITRDMVGRVLRRHELVAKEGKEYRLIGYDHLSDVEINALIGVCQQRLEEYIEKRGTQIFKHRRKSAGYIPGTLRYEILKQAQFHCELCGIPADEKALEVDHIVPRNKGGSDDTSNLQALCYSCNAMKRDRDDTDFRLVKESYKHREPGCLFCEISQDRIIAENRLAYAIRDGYAVTPLHTLIIPKRHVETYFDLSQSELKACNELIHQMQSAIREDDPVVSGFNVGANAGEDAGQSIFHCHIHLIPRRSGDVDNPRGGIRHVIPGKGHY